IQARSGGLGRLRTSPSVLVSVRYTLSTPATNPSPVNSQVNHGAVPNHVSRTRPNHQPSASATTNDSMPALSSHAVRTMFASDLLKPVITASHEGSKSPKIHEAHEKVFVLLRFS